MDELSVTEYIKKAFECKESGNYKQSIEYFYKALMIDNESSEIMSELAGLYFKINNTDRAIEFYEQALLCDPFNNDIKYNLASIHKHIGNMEKNINLLEALYKKNKDITYLTALINSLYIEGRYEEVIKLYNDCDYKENGTDKLYYNTALAYMALSKTDQAEYLLRQAYNINPNNNDVKYSLAELLFEKKNYFEAEKLLHSLLETRMSAKEYYLLGEINFAKNNLEKAVNYFSIAANTDYKNPLYFYELGTVYSLKGFMTEAEESFLKAVKLSPNNLLYNYTLAYLYYTTGEITKAKQKISYILSINPNHNDALVLKALLAYNEDNNTEASKIIDEVLENTQSNDFAFYVKSLIYKKLNWWDKAIETANKALALKPDSLEYLSELALYNYEAKLYGDTKSVCKKILDKDEKYIYAYILTAKAYFALKEYEKALKNLDLAISYDSNSDEAYFIKAKIFKEQSLNNTAVEMAKTSVGINPCKVEYYEFIAKCYYEMQNYKDAFYYFKEASDNDILNINYKYYMAKSAWLDGDMNNAVSNFSVAKRLEPSNVFITLEYADCLCEAGSPKKALDILKSMLSFNLSQSDEKALKDKIKETQLKLNTSQNRFEKWINKFTSK